MKLKTLLRFFIVFACFISIISIISPFLHARVPSPRPIDLWLLPGPSTFWSFMKTEDSQYELGLFKRELLFGEYWSGVRERGESFDVWVEPVLILMFEGQILTVLFAALAAFRIRTLLLFSSTTLNFFTIFCMWFVNTTLNPLFVRTFQIGFWLTFPSVALFFVASLASSRLIKKHE